MAFNPNIPQSTDQLSVSQGQLLANNTILGAIAGNGNNSSASINVTSGFNWIYLPTQVAAIPPTGSSFAAGNVALYSSTRPSTTINELYINKQNAGPTAVQIPATASILSTNASPGNNANGWTYLPSGLLLMWGRADTGSTAIGSYVISLPGGFPAFSQIFNIQFTSISNGAADPNSAYAAQAVLTAGQNFTVYQTARSTQSAPTNYTKFFYSIIGIPTTY